MLDPSNCAFNYNSGKITYTFRGGIFTHNFWQHQRYNMVSNITNMLMVEKQKQKHFWIENNSSDSFLLFTMIQVLFHLLLHTIQILWYKILVHELLLITPSWMPGNHKHNISSNLQLHFSFAQFTQIFPYCMFGCCLPFYTIWG